MIFSSAFFSQLRHESSVIGFIQNSEIIVIHDEYYISGGKQDISAVFSEISHFIKHLIESENIHSHKEICNNTGIEKYELYCPSQKSEPYFSRYSLSIG